MVIKQCRRIGKYNEDRKRPITIEFQLKDDMDYVLSNKSWQKTPQTTKVDVKWMEVP